ncbi:cilia- and flagella-associated protein 251 isoform X2 [Hemibagrus wyckioides]|nr:cilia- and flagella-associated protein 251 isoform X2 [Hemibagrus wyckioides]XP_058246319.1 cilia- and flagella-associated protein 251 isoform X2 [Hemibagrus wyckioides]XP_058246320.1 cilia- and flagella-associated protein 251 isoform X2 [Hemibagrus wyckioides]
MSSVEETEVFIPEQACVLTVPVHSLPSSITKKMSACPVRSDHPAVFISPVELRDKGTTQEPSPLTPGQFFLPVVSYNSKAFRMLQNFLHSGENSLQCSGENSQASSAFSRRKNSIVLFDAKIFLIVRKSKAPDWLLEKLCPTPLECEAPPINSNDDDITDGNRSEDGTGAEVLKEREADVMKNREEEEEHEGEEHEEEEEEHEEEEVKTPMKDASTNTPRVKLEPESDDGAAGFVSERGRDDEARSEAETHTGNETSSSDNGDRIKMIDDSSSAGKPTCCKRLLFTNLPGTNANGPRDKSEVKGQIGDMASVSAAAEIGDVSQNITEEENEDEAHSKNHASTHSGRGQSSRCESDVEVIDVNDDGENLPDTSSGRENAAGNNASQVEKMLEICESLKRRISDYVKSINCKRHDVTMETGDDGDELIIVDDDDDVIITDREIGNSRGHRFGDVANRCKHGISDEMKEETDSDVAVGGSTAKRCKLSNDTDSLLEHKCSESAVDPNSRVKDDDGDVEVIEVDDDDDVEICESDSEISALPERRGTGAESPAALETAKSCKRNVSESRRSDETKVDVQSDVEEQRINAKDKNLKAATAQVNDMKPNVTDDERFVKYHVSDVQRKRASESEEGEPVLSSRNQQDVHVMNPQVWVQSYLSEIPRVAEDPASAGGSEALLAGVSGSSAASEHRQLAGEQSEAINQSARGEGAGVFLHPVFPRASNETDDDLRRKENIDRIRERLRRMEEKLNTLRSSQH